MTAPLLLIGLMGPAGAGKDTAADHLEDHHGFVRYAFADPMRTMLEAAFTAAGIDYAHIYERKLKEEPVPGVGHSYRKLAQTLGTEWGRRMLDEDLWLRFADMTLGMPDAPVCDRIVVTDVRFPNEAGWIRRHGGVVLRIQRDTAPVRQHVSETAMQQIDAWGDIANNRGLDWLHLQLDCALEQLQREKAPA